MAHGEPDAARVARPVRRAAWGNGSGVIPIPRPRPTQLVSVEAEQRALVRRVDAWDPPHDQPRGDLLGLDLGRERGESDLGDFSVADPALGVLIEDRVGVLDRCLPIGWDALDRLADWWKLPGGDREASLAAQHRGDHIGLIER